MKHLLKKAWSNVFFQGGIAYTIANFIVVFINYFFNIIAARSLGPSDFGEIATFFSYLIILTTPTGILTTYFLLKIGGKNDTSSYVGSVLHFVNTKMRKYWFFIIVPTLILIPFVPFLTNLSPVTSYILLPTVLVTYYASIYDASLQGLHLFILFSIIGIIFTFTKLIGAVLTIPFSQGLAIVMIFIFIAYTVRLFISIIALRKNLKVKKILPFHFNTSKLLKDQQLILTFVSTFSIAFISNFDIIFVKKYFAAEDTGIFASWLLFSKVITIVLGPLISLSIIFFSNKKYEVKHQLFFIVTWILLAVTGFVSLMVYGAYSRFFIDAFLGPKFYPVIPFIEWASLAGTAYMMLLFMNNYFLAKGSKQIYILACAIPIYIALLYKFGTDIGNVMLINICFSFSIVGIYLLIFFKNRLVSLWKD